MEEGEQTDDGGKPQTDLQPYKTPGPLTRLASFVEKRWKALYLRFMNPLFPMLSMSAASLHTFITDSSWPVPTALLLSAIVLFIGVKVWIAEENENENDKNTIENLLAENEQLKEVVETNKASFEHQKEQLEKNCQERIDTLDSRLFFLKSFLAEFLESSIRRIGDDMNFGHEERVSIYHHDAGKFFLLARFSQDPKFRKKGLRPFYPDDEGCIGQAWKKGVFFTNDLPDPNTAIVGYKRAQRKHCNFPEDKVDDLRMKSRSYLVLTISSSGVSDKKIAVVVFESLQKDGLKMEDQETIEAHSAWKAINTMVKESADGRVQIEDLKHRGF